MSNILKSFSLTIPLVYSYFQILTPLLSAGWSLCKSHAAPITSPTGFEHRLTTACVSMDADFLTVYQWIAKLLNLFCTYAFLFPFTLINLMG